MNISSLLVQLNPYLAILDATCDLVRSSRIVIDEIPFEIIYVITRTRHIHISVDCRGIAVQDLMPSGLIMHVPVAAPSV